MTSLNWEKIHPTERPVNTIVRRQEDYAKQLAIERVQGSLVEIA